MKRVIIFSTAYYPFVSGAELAIKEITDRLVGDYEFDLITARLDRQLSRVEQLGNVTVYRIGWGVPKLDKLFLAAFGHRLGWRLHQHQPYQAVWAMMASFGGFAASSFKATAKIPFLLTLQEGDEPVDILRKVRLVQKKFHSIFSSANGLQSISKYLQHWGRQMGFRGVLDEVIPNGVAITAFSQKLPPQELASTRQLFGFSSDAVVLITTSRLSRKNGIEDVIRALPLLPNNVCFCICGIGELEEHLRAVVDDLGQQSRVRFLGFKDYLALPPLLQASDIFIRPSLSEGLGNSFLEAMAAGLITIGTPVGGIPDFLEDGVTGILCQPSQPASIASAVKRATELTVEQRQALQARALARVRDGYDWDVVGQQMKALFNKLTNV